MAPVVRLAIFISTFMSVDQLPDRIWPSSLRMYNLQVNFSALQLEIEPESSARDCDGKPAKDTNIPHVS